ncbi:MAG: ribosomal large subunit pseudouridine synthase B, partial [Acinetobacter sp.]|nr:ribosomal large subunit pseudouridine synthase B [Acinetobacter sp.]
RQDGNSYGNRESRQDGNSYGNRERRDENAPRKPFGNKSFKKF